MDRHRITVLVFIMFGVTSLRDKGPADKFFVKLMTEVERIIVAGESNQVSGILIVTVGSHPTAITLHCPNAGVPWPTLIVSIKDHTTTYNK